MLNSPRVMLFLLTTRTHFGFYNRFIELTFLQHWTKPTLDIRLTNRSAVYGRSTPTDRNASSGTL